MTDRARFERLGLTDSEVERLRRWLAGDDAVSLGSLFQDAAAYPDVSRAIRAAILATLDAARPTLDVEARREVWIAGWMAGAGQMTTWPQDALRFEAERQYGRRVIQEPTDD